jgi:hypothetical protein
MGAMAWWFLMTSVSKVRIQKVLLGSLKRPLAPLPVQTPVTLIPPRQGFLSIGFLVDDLDPMAVMAATICAIRSAMLGSVAGGNAGAGAGAGAGVNGGGGGFDGEYIVGTSELKFKLDSSVVLVR